MDSVTKTSPIGGQIPATLNEEGSLRFWLAILATGIFAGIGAAGLTKLLQFVQALAWSGSGTDILQAVAGVATWRHLSILVGAGLVTGLGQMILVRLSSGNGIDISSAIWFNAGRLPIIRTLGTAVLSVVVVAMGASLGREGAPKQVGAVFADIFSDRGRLSDEQRRLLVACGAGAGMGAAYGVPLGGALFALEVLRGVFALRLVLPALVCSLVATGVSLIALPNAPTYHLPAYPASISSVICALLLGPIAGLVSVGYVRGIAWADRNRSQSWRRFLNPLIMMSCLGTVSLKFPQILGNGKDLSQLLFTGQVTISLLLALLILRPMATILCTACGIPGGLFTPSLTIGALLGATVGYVWLKMFPGGAPLGLIALMGAGAVLAATTQGPISAVVLMMELTSRDRSFMLPLLVAVVTATLVARMIESRSIYEARLSDEEIRRRLKARYEAFSGDEAH